MSEEKLLHLLQKKKGFFEAILDLTEEEVNLPLDAWISTLEQKKILLSCIEEIDSELAPFQKALHDLTQDINEELENIRSVVKRILHIDALNQKHRRQAIRQEIGE